MLPVLLRCRYGDGGEQNSDVRIDRSTDTLQMIDYEHAEAHAGNLYHFHHLDADVGNAEVIGFRIVTPNTLKKGHFVWQVDGALITLVELFEDSTRPAGAAQVLYNADRDSENTSGLTIHLATFGSGADGTRIDGASFGISTGGGANKISGGGSARGGEEWILGQNKIYLLKVTSGAAANNITIKTIHYEHTAKHPNG